MGAVALSVLGACHRGAPDARGDTVSQGNEKPGAAEAQQPEPPESPDARLGREVREKLYGDPDLYGGGSIAVFVDGRRVILEGWVGTVNERTLAEADAATVRGVSTVDNRLLVRGAGR